MLNFYMLFTVVLATIFIGCGGGSDSGDSKPTDEVNTTKEIEEIVTIPNCTVELPTYKDLISKDKIVPQSDNTSIQILHSDDDKKRICTTTGEAVILRKTIITGIIND